MSDISVIGLGAMGSALARTLIKNGYIVTVWNRSKDKIGPLVSEGAIAAGSASEAIDASLATIICIKSHDQTLELLQTCKTSLNGKTIIELSTGGASEADALTQFIAAQGGSWLVGIINSYPTAIGGKDTVLTVVGEPALWEKWQPHITALGGGSIHVGTNASMLAALFAALFTTRQGFMFGMLYGALVCQKAGIPLDNFAKLIPVSMGVLPSYHQYFADTAPTGNFDNPPATMATYTAALDDALKTFDEVGAPNELPKLFSDAAHKGMDAGLEDKALTALVELFNRN
ncbi:2-hydroxy-3-oxopropionate reductase [Roseovarius albus]|uniref:2-hydroxy-3-oxopropionate reductase n=1 Tax=Roseovarius albus TaxID=1247867 RepID=A0A1X6YTX6_9RHOB|nr:NAD(P)-binding domain-containing protein [Roseovarius albus]SLN30565.1 2-hydroxy-3-oxopropionate reductase [Roseovarius albus]